MVWLKTWRIRILSAAAVIALAAGGCSYLNKKMGLKDDNIIESNLEDMIESHTGISIDLTPGNPDDDDYSLDMWRKD